MTHEIIFAPEAQTDLLKLYDDIETNSGAERARDYTDHIIAQCLSLANFPERGRRRDDLRPELRIISFRRRVTIAFHITATTVIIDHVLYGVRDLKPLFDEEDDD